MFDKIKAAQASDFLRVLALEEHNKLSTEELYAISKVRDIISDYETDSR